VAEHVADLPIGEATEALLPHLWYDRDWESAAAAALATHPERAHLLTMPLPDRRRRGAVRVDRHRARGKPRSARNR
jgi:hypothetical protein